MDFSQLISTRQSCRAYDSTRSVPRETLAACLEAARLAPSACNAQPYHFTVVTGENARAVGDTTRSMGLNKFTPDVPTFVVISEANYNATSAVGSKVKGQDYRSVDIGIAAAYFTARATELGLSTCIIGWFDEKKLRQLVGAKGTVRLVIAVGYAKEGDVLRKKVRKDLDTLVTWM